jgi:xanthine dehydrogenase/oxidase
MEQFSTPRPEADLSVKGEFFTGPQIHFPLETQSCFVEPKQGDRYEVTVSGQWPGLELKALQIVLGVKQHQLHIKTPRCGGGFGSKLMHQLPSLCATAVSAHKLKRPIRFQNERSDECRTVGCRNGIDFKYNATFDAEGMLDTLDLTATSDVGFIPEWGAAFAANVHVESDGVYKWPTLKGEAAARPASQYLNTWARAPHTMQQALFSDVIMEHIAKTVGIDVDAVRQQNFYKDGDTMYDGSKIDNAKGINFTIPQMWEQVQKDANYEQRKKDVAEYNKANRWTKKGVAISAMKWNMAVNAFYNVNCHIVVYSDGTLHVTTDCVEIGQGLNTKVAMAIAQVLSIDMDLIHVGSNDTSITANDGATGGSASSEACAEAARMAAVILKESIQDPFQKEDTDWPTAVGQARMAGVAMVADGWYNKSAANPETTYVVYGTSCAEVLSDVLTGDSRVESVDIMMDQGTQINAAVDIGQIQGGYVMALGYLFSEEVKFDENGVNPHLGTWEYKIPTAYDIPVKFNTRLLKDSPNPAAVFHGSKAVAEPPMGLISATYLALKNAMYAAREEVGLGSDWFDLPVPCSPEVIREKIAVPEDQIALPK